MNSDDVETIEDMARDDRETYTTVELRLPGANTPADLAEIFGDDLQECVRRVSVIRPGEYF